MRPYVSALLLGAKKSGAEEKSLTDGADGMAGVEEAEEEGKGFQSVPPPY